jgi:hypothetical protein
LARTFPLGAGVDVLVIFAMALIARRSRSTLRV